MGNLTIDLYTTVRPQTCTNFLKLSKLKFFNFSLLYNLKRDFCCQMGKSWDKTIKDSSYFVYLYGKNATKFQNEKDAPPRIKHNKMGQISMVVDKNGYHSSQFIILLGDDERQLSYLDQCGHSPFGECVLNESFATLSKINESIVDEEDRPYDDIRIIRINIIYDPFPDPVNKVPQLTRAISPIPTIKLLEDYRMPKNIAGYEEIENLSDIDDEYEEKRDANQRAAVLEMVGDLPNKDVTPDENVLFVCKLNPATQDEDLELIFSRFGEIKNCDIIRDQKLGDSLQYAFIEFEDVEDCEKAVLKMDNVLIDERRIHVDFSQSVAKQWWRWRKNGKYMNCALKTDQYLEDLNLVDEPSWQEKKVNYTNKWAASAADQTDVVEKPRDRESLSDFKKDYSRNEKKIKSHRYEPYSSSHHSRSNKDRYERKHKSDRY